MSELNVLLLGLLSGFSYSIMSSQDMRPSPTDYHSRFYNLHIDYKTPGDTPAYEILIDFTDYHDNSILKDRAGLLKRVSFNSSTVKDIKDKFNDWIKSFVQTLTEKRLDFKEDIEKGAYHINTLLNASSPVHITFTLDNYNYFVNHKINEDYIKVIKTENKQNLPPYTLIDGFEKPKKPHIKLINNPDEHISANKMFPEKRILYEDLDFIVRWIKGAQSHNADAHYTIMLIKNAPNTFILPDVVSAPPHKPSLLSKHGGKIAAIACVGAGCYALKNHPEIAQSWLQSLSHTANTWYDKFLNYISH